MDPENKTCVFNAKDGRLSLKTVYKGYVESPAGIFFTSNFE